ncbi:MAG: DUF3501 family protein [Acidobacteriales bacterium]|nr:DUF3501 family protein [Terriglobales bacterium]
MQLVAFEEIKNLADYEVERESLRPRMMALKDRRRVRVGGHLTFLFENRETVRYQIQEMLRIERLVKPQEVRHELETYNELIPGPGQLSASLLIEYGTPEERAVYLRELLGIENHVWLVVDGTAPVLAVFDARQISTDRVSSVQYIKFQLSPEQVTRFAKGAAIRVDHPYYNFERPLTPAELSELAEDLR